MRFVPSSVVVATLIGLSAAGASRAAAQAQTSGTRFGVEAAFADHFNLGLGAFVKFHLADLQEHPITGRVTFDYFFPSGSDFCGDDSNCSAHYFQVDADALYDIANSKSNLKPYVGAGLGYSHFSESGNDCGLVECDFAGSSGGLGLNIMGGINFNANSKLMPFVEVKLGLGGSAGGFGGSVFELKGGIHF